MRELPIVDVSPGFRVLLLCSTVCPMVQAESTVIVIVSSRGEVSAFVLGNIAIILASNVTQSIDDGNMNFLAEDNLPMCNLVLGIL